MFDRWYTAVLLRKMRRPYVHLVFGARQTGKSTLIRQLLPREAFIVDLSHPEERMRYLAHPGEFVAACRALPARRGASFVFVDEVQSVPAIFDAVQHLYDGDKGRWRFILCGSSARKLRNTGANLLPGRSMLHRIAPLTLLEHPSDSSSEATAASPLPLPWPTRAPRKNLFPTASLATRLAFGDLPGIVAASKRDQSDLLRTYATVHLEEEIRREGLVRDWAAFVRFLTLAAAESGSILNYAGISQESGISQPTVKAHYQLLEDMFMGFSVPAFSGSPRKNVLSSPKFLFFDLGVRHAAMNVSPSPNVVRAAPGPLFEQWVGIELWKRLTYLDDGSLHHLRTKDGSEVDFIVERGGRLTPIEVKYTEHPTLKDARHLLTFINENKRAKHGFVICRASRPLALHQHITALPWFLL